MIIAVIAQKKNQKAHYLSAENHSSKTSFF